MYPTHSNRRRAERLNAWLRPLPLLLAALHAPPGFAYLVDLHNDIQVHDVSATPVYTWKATATGKVPVNDALRATFEVTYDLSPLEEGFRMRKNAGPFWVTETYLLVNAETAPDTVVKATVASSRITAANQTFTYNPPWGTTTLGSELANSGNATAEYRIERRRAVRNENSDIVTLSPGALAGGAAGPVRANSAGIVYNGAGQAAANIAPLGADIPSVAVAFGGPLSIYSLASAGAGQLLIRGFNDSGHSLQLASSGAQVRVQDTASNDAAIQFASSVSFNELWADGTFNVGTASTAGGVWSVSDGSLSPAPYSAYMLGGRPELLPGDGETLLFDAANAPAAGDNALWLFFNVASTETTGESIGFLITGAVPEPPALGLFAAGLIAVFGRRALRAVQTRPTA
jgi:hypothetical protein